MTYKETQIHNAEVRCFKVGQLRAEGLTFKQIAAEFGVSAPRARQLYNKHLKYLARNETI